MRQAQRVLTLPVALELEPGREARQAHVVAVPDAVAGRVCVQRHVHITDWVARKNGDLSASCHVQRTDQHGANGVVVSELCT